MKKQKTLTQQSLETIIIIMIIMLSTNLSFAQWTIDEGFEGGVIPAGWTTSTWGVYSTPGYPHTGTYLAASGMGNDWLITPQVYIQSGDSFIFWARAWNGTESFNVKLSTTGTATGDFTTTLGTYTGVGETWVEYSYDLSSYTGNIYLAIEVISGGDYVLALDDVLVGQEAVSCPAPSNTNVTNILETQADFGWTENGSATDWNIEVGTPGFTPGTTAYIQAYTGVTSNPYTGTGLTASTNYEFYVQSDCGGGETSTWAGPEAFSTQDMVWGLLVGDIAFTAFNADGDDDFAIVALIDIPANATIYFTDNEPNATGDGFLDFNEGTLKWATGGSVISAGTIVVFTDTDSDTNPLFGASVGTLSVPSFDSGMNLSSSGDALYAVEGSPEGDNIAAWLAGIQNEAGNEGANFSATGLTFGTTFINFYTTGSPDGGYYHGARFGESSFSAYLPSLGDNSNWTVDMYNGENILPISTEAFTLFFGPDNPASFTATPASSSEIDLDWTQNAGSNDVLVAWNSSNTFGTPTNGTTYNAGNPITGGGTVLYYGPALHFDHTSLTASTPYFYKAWSYDGSEYSFGVTDDATTLCVPYTADFSENFDGETPPELPGCWSHLEISTSTFGYVETSTISSYSPPNNVRMYKVNTVDDLLLITPQLGDLTSQTNQIRFMGRVSGWAQDLIIGTMSDPTDETTFTAFQTIPITIFNVYEEYTVVFDDSYTLSDEYIAFKHGADINYSYLNIDDFVYEAIPSAGISVNLNAFLEGPFNGTDMNTDLNPDLIPLSQPYNIAPWNYTGTESVESIPNANVMDWVLVELRDTTEAQYATGSTIIARQAAFMLNDGSIVGLDGTSFLTFNVSIEDNLFAVIRHRNHLGVLSANALSGLGDVYFYDFTTGADKAYGTDAQKYLSSGIYGMISGDVDASGLIDQDDKSIYWEPSAGTTDYNNSDLNLDTEVDNKDKDDFWVSNFGSGSQVPE